MAPQSNQKRGRPSTSTIFQQFAASQKTLAEYGGLPDLQSASKIWDDIWFVEAHNSTAIEGNTLVLREVKALLQSKRSIGGKKTVEYLEVIGYGEAAKWVYSQGREPETYAPDDKIISLSEIRFIHETLMRPVWEIAPHEHALPTEKPGSFRQHDILPFGGGMKPPSFTEIQMLMTDYVARVDALCKCILNGETQAADIPATLAYLHCGFERIHPFLDGNGRTGRLVLNLLLVRLGFPPCIILKQRRTSYLKALDSADNENYKPLAEIIARGVLDNVHRFIVPELMQDENLVTLESLVDKEFSYNALRQAALRGKLQANIGEDGRYYSTKQAVKEYKASRYKR